MGLLGAWASWLWMSVALAGGAAPDFSLRTIEPEQGAIKLSDYRGKVVLLDFWATWCEPCKVEMKHLQAMQTELGPQGFVVLAVSTDDARTRSQVKPYVKRMGYSFTVPLDPDSSVLTQYNPGKVLPFSVLIDREGNVVSVHQGYNPGDEVALKAEIIGALGSSAPAPVEASVPPPSPAAPAP